jgi:hypothetical protein
MARARLNNAFPTAAVKNMSLLSALSARMAEGGSSSAASPRVNPIEDQRHAAQGEQSRSRRLDIVVVEVEVDDLLGRIVRARGSRRRRGRRRLRALRTGSRSADRLPSRSWIPFNGWDRSACGGGDYDRSLARPETEASAANASSGKGLPEALAENRAQASQIIDSATEARRRSSLSCGATPWSSTNGARGVRRAGRSSRSSPSPRRLTPARSPFSASTSRMTARLPRTSSRSLPSPMRPRRRGGGLPRLGPDLADHLVHRRAWPDRSPDAGRLLGS